MDKEQALQISVSGFTSFDSPTYYVELKTGIDCSRVSVAYSSDHFVLCLIGSLEVGPVVTGSLSAPCLGRPSAGPVHLRHDSASAGSEQHV